MAQASPSMARQRSMAVSVSQVGWRMSYILHPRSYANDIADFDDSLYVLLFHIMCRFLRSFLYHPWRVQSDCMHARLMLLWWLLLPDLRVRELLLQDVRLPNMHP